MYTFFDRTLGRSTRRTTRAPVTRHGSGFLVCSRYTVCEHSLTSPEGSGRGENPGNSTNNGPVARARARVGGSFNATGGDGRPGAHYHTLAGSRRAAWLSFRKLSDAPLLQNDNQAVRSAKLSLLVIGGADMARFDNKVVLVSGGARGQGAAEARLLV